MSIPEHHATLYRPDYCGLARNYCRLGASNAELAEFFDVEPDDIATWIVNIPEFRAAVHGARGVARAKVRRGLYQRAVGYTCELERTEIHRGEKKTLTRTVHYAPDPRAGIYWLEHEEGGEGAPGDGQGNGGGSGSPSADGFVNDRDGPQTALYPQASGSRGRTEDLESRDHGEPIRIENCPHPEDTPKSTPAPERPLDQMLAAPCSTGKQRRTESVNCPLQRTIFPSNQMQASLSSRAQRRTFPVASKAPRYARGDSVTHAAAARPP